MDERHEIRVDDDRAWCETCGWSDQSRAGGYRAWSLACMHFSGPDPQVEPGHATRWPFWGSCEFCEWPDRVWPSGPPHGETGATEWPCAATWQWDIGDLRHGTDWVLTCDAHQHLGPATGPRVHRQRLVLA